VRDYPQDLLGRRNRQIAQDTHRAAGRPPTYLGTVPTENSIPSYASTIRIRVLAAYSA
jgi:hypothetical protein